MISVNTELWIQPTQPRSGLEQVRPSSFLIPIELDRQWHLVINGLSGALDLVSREEYDRYFVDQLPRLAGPDMPQALLERAHWIDLDTEQRLTAELCRNAHLACHDDRMFFYLCTTNYCPMGCAYCSQGSGPRRAHPQSMSPEMVRQAFTAIGELCRRQRRDLAYVALFGGEPLQGYCVDTVREILRQARQRRIEIFIFTNALELESYVPLLSQYPDILTGVSVTLDGSEDYHNARRAAPNAFARAARGADRLAAADIPVQIRTNIGRSGLDQVAGLRRFYEERGWWDHPRFSFELAPLTNHGCRPGFDRDVATHAETARMFYELVKENPVYLRFRFIGMFSYLYYAAQQLDLLSFHADELGSHVAVPRIHGCPANTGSTFTLVSDGSMHLCNEQANEEECWAGFFSPQLQIDEKFLQVWSARTVETIGDCGQCPYRFFCGGGCSLSAAKKHDGDIGHATCESLPTDFQQFFQSTAADIRSRWITPHAESPAS